ncbi:hypothetical protein BN1708_013267 [Verticillium longisporum]|uniref:Uncharacterized protein n=1 Tax=Verticillium longisporum TaxID=100787 RepID=A0A0G4LJA5_VERLO|nr:hypothetical protein BN1708_013267 [Verticillium longisporum]
MSRNGLTPRISQMMQPRLQMSDAYDKGVVGSKRGSGGRVLRGRMYTSHCYDKLGSERSGGIKRE